MYFKIKDFLEKNWVLILLIQLTFNLIYLTLRNESGTYAIIGEGGFLLNTKTGDTYYADSNDNWQLEYSFNNGVVPKIKNKVVSNDSIAVDSAAAATEYKDEVKIDSAILPAPN